MTKQGEVQFWHSEDGKWSFQDVPEWLFRTTGTGLGSVVGWPCFMMLFYGRIGWRTYTVRNELINRHDQ